MSTCAGFSTYAGLVVVCPQRPGLAVWPGVRRGEGRTWPAHTPRGAKVEVLDCTDAGPPASPRLSCRVRASRIMVHGWDRLSAERTLSPRFFFVFVCGVHACMHVDTAVIAAISRAAGWPVAAQGLAHSPSRQLIWTMPPSNPMVSAASTCAHLALSGVMSSTASLLVHRHRTAWCGVHIRWDLWFRKQKITSVSPYLSQHRGLSGCVLAQRCCWQGRATAAPELAWWCAFCLVMQSLVFAGVLWGVGRGALALRPASRPLPTAARPAGPM